MITLRTIPALLIAGCLLAGCANNTQEVWSSKGDSVGTKSTRASVVADDQPIPPQKFRPNEPVETARIEPSQETNDPAAPPPAPAPVAEQHTVARHETPHTIQNEPQIKSEPATSLTGMRQQAIEILLKSADARNPQLRANAIEALQPAPEYLEPVVRKALADDNRGVRFVAAMTIGKLKIISLAPLLEPMLHDDSESVQAAAIYGLRRCGREVNPTPLADMLMSEDPEVKANAALVLGELGDKSAIQLLEHAVGRGMTRVAPARVKIVELQLAEAMVKLGAESQVVPIRAALFSPAEEAELVAFACQMSGRMHDGKAAPDLTNLLLHTGPQQRPPEVRMAAAAALAQIQPPRLMPEVPLAYIDSDQYQVRAQAATTLGIIGDRNTLPQLERMMNDQNALVQTAAAGAVLQMSK